MWHLVHITWWFCLFDCRKFVCGTLSVSSCSICWCLFGEGGGAGSIAALAASLLTTSPLSIATTLSACIVSINLINAPLGMVISVRSAMYYLTTYYRTKINSLFFSQFLKSAVHQNCQKTKVYHFHLLSHRHFYRMPLKRKDYFLCYLHIGGLTGQKNRDQFLHNWLFPSFIAKRWKLRALRILLFWPYFFQIDLYVGQLICEYICWGHFCTID